MITDKDRRATIVHNFIAGHEYEVVVRAIGPDGLQEARESAARATIMIKGKLTTPSPPTDLATEGYLTSILLTWVNPFDYDVKHVEIWRATTNALSLAAKIAEVKGITYMDAIGASNVSRYYWLRAVNTSGEVSDYTDSVVGTSSGIGATDIDDFSIIATKMFTNTVVLSGDTWSNNTPGGGSIAWNAHYITFNGAYYLISAGNTALRYVTWTEGDTGGGGTVADPYISSYAGAASWTAVVNKFNIAINESGVHQLVWNSSANMVIGSAFILDAAIIEAKIGNLAVTDAKIVSLGVTKLTSGTITSKLITLATAASVDCAIRAGKTLWDNSQTGFILGIDAATPKFYIGSPTKYLNWDGSVLTIRGTLNADDLVAGTVTGRTIQTAASGVKRAMVDGPNNKIVILDAADNELIKLDDAVYGGLPGVLMERDGFVRIAKSGTEFSTLGANYLQVQNATAGLDVINASCSVSLNPNINGIFRANYFTGYTGNVFIGELNNVAKSKIDESGNCWLDGDITLNGDVDGRNVSVDGTKLDTIETDANDYTHPTFSQFGESFTVGNKVVSYDSNGHVTVTEET